MSPPPPIINQLIMEFVQLSNTATLELQQNI
jgi:hypothetical protein